MNNFRNIWILFILLFSTYWFSIRYVHWISVNTRTTTSATISGFFTFRIIDWMLVVNECPLVFPTEECWHIQMWFHEACIHRKEMNHGKSRKLSLHEQMSATRRDVFNPPHIVPLRCNGRSYILLFIFYHFELVTIGCRLQSLYSSSCFRSLSQNVVCRYWNLPSQLCSCLWASSSC